MDASQSSADLELADLIGDLLNVAYDDKYMHSWLGSCAEALNCRSAALVTWAGKDPESAHSLTYGDSKLADTRWCDWFKQLLKVYIPEGPCLLEDLIAELYNAKEWAGDYDVEGLISMAPALPPTTKMALISYKQDIVVLLLEHAPDQVWTQDDAARIRFISKHLTNANQVASHVYNCRWGSTICSTLMDAAPRGLSILGRQGHLGYATSKLRVIFDMNDGLSLENGKIRFQDKSQEQEFYRQVDTLESIGEGTYNVSVERPSGKPAFQVLLMAMKTNSSTYLSVGNQTFLTVYIHNPTDEVKLSIDQLRTYYGFTKAEANVARALFMYTNLQEAADSLHVSINTVRTHLRRVYEKANVSNQAELMRTLAGALRTEMRVDEDRIQPLITGTPGTRRKSWGESS